MTASDRARRRHERFEVAPMYTAVTARRAGRAGLHGHVYDISAGGARIELDEPLEPGERVAVHLELPGTDMGVDAAASVVWVHDADDDPGPRRMALKFTGFSDRADEMRLRRFLESSTRRAA